VVNLHRKEGGHFKPDLGGQYHRILQSYFRMDRLEIHDNFREIIFY